AEAGEHGAGDVRTLEPARGELAVRQLRQRVVAQRHGARLLDAGQEGRAVLEEAAEQARGGLQQVRKRQRGHWSVLPQGTRLAPDIFDDTYPNASAAQHPSAAASGTPIRPATD